jgi:hypothetical protein
VNLEQNLENDLKQCQAPKLEEDQAQVVNVTQHLCICCLEFQKELNLSKEKNPVLVPAHKNICIMIKFESCKADPAVTSVDPDENLQLDLIKCQSLKK